MNDHKNMMRSLMFVPGHSEKLIYSAANCNADILLLDIEDSVQPESNKTVARKLIKTFVSNGLLQNQRVFPRVNDRESGHLLKDIYELTIPGIEGFMYPKARKGEDIYFIDKLLETIEYEKQIPVGTFKIIALIETTAAVLNAQEICRASNRVIAIAYGCEDFIADLEGFHDCEGQSIYVPRALIAMAARANGVAPIDTVHINVHDLEDLERNLKLSRHLGFEGMLVLHPKELPLVHQYYSPSSEDLEKAKEIIRLADEAHGEGKGVAIREGKFIGPPMVKAAKKIVDKYGMASSENEP